jgi:hypothetical protein
LLAGDESLTEGDRRTLLEQLASLHKTPSTGKAVERDQIAALKALQSLAPKIWDLAAPVVAAIATTEMKRQLGLPPL